MGRFIFIFIDNAFMCACLKNGLVSVKLYMGRFLSYNVLVSRMGWFLLNYIWTDFCLIMYLSQEWVGFPSRNVRADFYHIMYLSQKFDDFRHIRNVLMY